MEDASEAEGATLAGDDWAFSPPPGEAGSSGTSLINAKNKASLARRQRHHHLPLETVDRPSEQFEFAADFKLEDALPLPALSTELPEQATAAGADRPRFAAAKMLTRAGLRCNQCFEFHAECLCPRQKYDLSTDRQYQLDQRPLLPNPLLHPTAQLRHGGQRKAWIRFEHKWLLQVGLPLSSSWHWRPPQCDSASPSSRYEEHIVGWSCTPSHHTAVHAPEASSPLHVTTASSFIRIEFHSRPNKGHVAAGGFTSD